MDICPTSATRIALICNGSLDHTQKMKLRIEAYPLIIAVDGGTKHCHHLGLMPNLIIGDFDSCPPALLDYFSDIPCKRFPIDKDKTDLELALDELMCEGSGTDEITLFGALGNRIDHTINNLLILSRFPGRLFIESHNERLFVINKQASLSCFIGQTISLIPLNGPVTGINTQGFEWNLSNATLDKNFIGISNQATQQNVCISMTDGDLLCCIYT